jgi:hypothetical protein
MLSEGGRLTLSHSVLNEGGIVVGIDVVFDESFEADNNVETLPVTVDLGIHALTTTTGTVQSAVVQVRSKILIMAIVVINFCFGYVDL